MVHLYRKVRGRKAGEHCILRANADDYMKIPVILSSGIFTYPQVKIQQYLDLQSCKTKRCQLKISMQVLCVQLSLLKNFPFTPRMKLE